MPLRQNQFRSFYLYSDKIYLAQTDTTVGFLSSDYKKLNNIKKRYIDKKILQVVDSFKTLKLYTRVPNKFKTLVRYSKKTTFIYPNKKSFRVISLFDTHHNFIKKFNILYSTSANITNQSFDINYAIKSSDIIVLSKNGFVEKKGSFVYKLSNNRLKKIR